MNTVCEIKNKAKFVMYGCMSFVLVIVFFSKIRGKCYCILMYCICNNNYLIRFAVRKK